MGRLDRLAAAYRNHIALPWQRGLAGAEKAIFIVYDKTDERRIRARRSLFELVTKEAGHKWKEIDLTLAFPEWMSQIAYREEYFQNPQALRLKLAEFRKYLAEKVRRVLQGPEMDEDTVLAIVGVASLFGYARVSELMKDIEPDIRGRVVVFFPGEYDNNVYRLLDARDGWNYLAVPITAHNGATE